MNTIDKIAQKVIDSAVTGNKTALAVCHAILMTKASRDEVVDSVKYKNLLKRLRELASEILFEKEWDLLLSTDLQEDFLIPVDMFCSYLDASQVQFPVLLYHDTPRIYMLGVSVDDWEFTITENSLICTNLIKLPDSGYQTVEVIYAFTPDCEPILVQVSITENPHNLSSNDLLVIANMQYEFLMNKITQKGKRFIA
jgi:hypothetical protein